MKTNASINCHKRFFLRCICAVVKQSSGGASKATNANHHEKFLSRKLPKDKLPRAYITHGQETGVI